MTCNPLIIDAAHDLEGRWEVWCRRCASSWYAGTPGEARLMQQHHQPKTWEPTEESVDWSEHVAAPHPTPDC